MSDVHVEREMPEEPSEDTHVYRVEFVIPKESDEYEEDDDDGDGDLVVQRVSAPHSLLIEHAMATELKDVGWQLWRASFYLADFLIANAAQWRDKCVLELGAGLGLTSLVASLFARRVLCTDLPHVLPLAERNWRLNRARLDAINNNSNSNSNSNSVRFKQLDWTKYEELKSALDRAECAEVAALSDADVLMAADCVYDNELTACLLNTIYALMTRGGARRVPKVAYVANETRINFSTAEMRVADTAFEFFSECVRELDGYVDAERGWRFRVERVDGQRPPPKFLADYKRSAYLSIWAIHASPVVAHETDEKNNFL